MTMRAIGSEFYAKGEMAKFDQLAATLRAMEAALLERAEEDATRKAAEQKRNGTQVPVPTDELADLADLMADDGA